MSEEYSDLLDEAGVKDITDLAKRDSADLLEAAEKNIVRRPLSLKQVKVD